MNSHTPISCTLWPFLCNYPSERASRADPVKTKIYRGGKCGPHDR